MEDNEFITKRELCENCLTNEYKYKCPRCLFKSCCLICVKEHKRIKRCSGVKDKFSKEHVKGFKDNDYYRDINFLNKAMNATNSANKKIFNLDDKEEDEVLKEKKHKNLKKLAKKFRNIILECSPSIMQKFKENQSYCDSKLKKFFWTVKFIFLTNNQELSYIFLEPLDDAVETLDLIYEKIIKERLDINLLEVFNKLEKDKIKFLYKDVTRSDTKEIVTIDKNNYIILDRDTLLKDILNGKTIFEYPEFYII
jgi:hypothetical protein